MSVHVARRVEEIADALRPVALLIHAEHEGVSGNKPVNEKVRSGSGAGDAKPSDKAEYGSASLLLIP